MSGPTIDQLVISDPFPSPNQNAGPESLPIETRFPVPALRSVMESLINDSREEQLHKGCCPAMYGKWSADLYNFSLAARYFREEVWAERLRRLVLRRDVDFQRLESVITPDCRHWIKEITITAHAPSKKPTSKRVPIASSLGKPFVKRMNAFLLTCNNLELLRDNCSAHRAELAGPSLHHPTVRALHLRFPFLIFKGKAPFNDLFPGVEHLEISEDGCYLAESLKTVQEKLGINGLQHIDGIFCGQMPNIKELTLSLTPSNEENVNDWASKGFNMFGLLLRKCPNLQRLRLIIDPAYTTNWENACQIPYVMFMVGESRAPIKEVTILSTGFDWRRLNHGLMSHSEARWLPLEQLLPHGTFLERHIRKYASKNLAFRRFHFKHLDNRGEVPSSIREFEITFKEHRTGPSGLSLVQTMEHWPIGTVLKDSADSDSVQSLNQRWSVIVDPVIAMWLSLPPDKREAAKVAGMRGDVPDLPPLSLEPWIAHMASVSEQDTLGLTIESTQPQSQHEQGAGATCYEEAEPVGNSSASVLKKKQGSKHARAKRGGKTAKSATAQPSASKSPAVRAETERSRVGNELGRGGPSSKAENIKPKGWKHVVCGCSHGGDSHGSVSEGC